MSSPSYVGQRVTILGMARQGMALARFFLSAGARVTMSDQRPAEQLAACQAELERYAAEHVAGLRPGSGVLPAEAGPPRRSPTGLEDLHVRFVLGGHPLTLLDDADLLCLSGGVSPEAPIVQAATSRGIPLSNDAQLTLQHCPAPVLAITGSAGKTTTTTLVGLMLEAAGFIVHMGGNIGTPLIDRLNTIRPGDKVVLELSSFQLELLQSSPSIAAVLNITPNHLDRHPSMSHYAAAKANILQFQVPGDICVLNADDAFTGPWLRTGRCQITEGMGQPAAYFPIKATRLGFSLEDEVMAGAFMQAEHRRSVAQEDSPAQKDVLVLRQPGVADEEVCRVGDVRLRGRHNLANILAACCLAASAGVEVAVMSTVVANFGGVEHRLEPVRKRDNILWVNDSIATAPERTVAALRSFSERIVLLAGGQDKHLPWDECAAVIHESTQDGSQKVRHVVLFGEGDAVRLIEDALLQYERKTGAPAISLTHCTDLQEAVVAAARVARPGDVVLLAPGGTSFDAYEDFAARGQHFRSLVKALP
jgi:UDP-N-acetylmuramoylalanine--D-glutamate ligase